MRSLCVVFAGLALAGCAAANPQETSLKLNMQDPLYDTADCRAARQTALLYDDKVPQRAAEGVAIGLLLGPFGLPIAAGIDANQDKQRKLLNWELTRSCVTGGAQIVAAEQAKEQAATAIQQAAQDSSSAH
jgi:hypothetical protein